MVIVAVKFHKIYISVCFNQMLRCFDENGCITCDGYWLVDPLNDEVADKFGGGAWNGCAPFIVEIGCVCAGNGGGANDIGLLLLIGIWGLLLTGSAFGCCVMGIMPGLPGYAACGCGGMFANDCCWCEIGGEICVGGAFCAEKSLFNDKPAIWFGKLYKIDYNIIIIKKNPKNNFYFLIITFGGNWLPL